MNMLHLFPSNLNRLLGRALVALTVTLSIVLSAATALPRAYANEGNVVSAEGTPTAALQPTPSDPPASLAELAPLPAPTPAGADNAELGEPNRSEMPEFPAVLLPSDTLPLDLPSAEGDPGAEGELVLEAMSGVARTSPVVQLAAGQHHTCARTRNGYVFCWGQTAAGTFYVPRPVLGLSGVVGLVSNDDHVCARLGSSRVMCWGKSINGQLGDGSRMAAATPQFVSRLSGVAGLAAGKSHVCARTRSGLAFCWGYNFSGQLGDGSRRSVHAPMRLALLNSVTGLAAGGVHTCAVTSNRSAYCWGRNAQGQLGVGDFQDRLSPQQVINLSNITGIAAGDAHTCAYTSSGQLYCWGDNYYGQLGSGSGFFDGGSSSPRLVNLSNVTGVVAGVGHTCARTTAGEVFCWGDNQYGQLGDGQSRWGANPQPRRVLNLPADDPVVTLAAGFYHTCAATQSGRVYCWGRNQYGQLGNGTTSWDPVTLPVQVAGTPSLPEPRQIFLPIVHTRP